MTARVNASSNGYVGTVRGAISETTADGIRLWDGVMAFWIALWLVVGGWTGHEIWQLTSLSQSTVESGRSLQGAADALARVSEVPFVGDVTGPLGEQVGATASNIVAGGQEAGRSIRALAVLVGSAVALGPTAPVLLLYLPARWARRRRLRALRSALRADPSNRSLRAHLAGQALLNLPPTDLAALTDDAAADLAEGRWDSLADAELRRLGLRIPARTRGPR